MNDPSQTTTLEAQPESSRAIPWSYEKAFARHRGLLTAAEQERLQNCRVAVIGMGGVGGIHLVTLARLGISAFTIADPDRFELANFNRQYGADAGAIGRGKADVMAEKAAAINPQLDVRVFSKAVTRANVADFLAGVDVLVDGVDFFSVETRRLVFGEAASRGIWAVTAGPVGFSTAWLTFSPDGMSFDRYFDLRDEMDRLDKLIAFAVGLAPRATHLPYLDLAQVDLSNGTGPSAALACHLASGVTAAEIIKILLGRGPIRPAPWYFQFDAYRQLLCKGRLRGGNRHPLQRLKRWWLRRKFCACAPPGHQAAAPACLTE